MSGISCKKPWQGLVCGAGGSVIADTLCTPLDVLKVRLQLSRSGVVGEQYRGIVDAIFKMGRSEGLRGFYKGLSPALLRSATYGTARLGLYEPTRKFLTGGSGGADTLPVKLTAGLLSGGVSSLIFNPCDLVKIRMQGDRTGTRYRNVFHAFAVISKQEGVTGLWRGSTIGVTRAALCTMVEITAYVEAKRLLLESGRWGYPDSHIATHLVSSFAAGLVSIISSHPMDLVKSRLMNQPVNKAGAPTLYNGVVDCFMKTLRSEGVRGLYAGFWPSYMRLGPHTMLTFVCIEQIRNLTGWAS